MKEPWSNVIAAAQIAAVEAITVARATASTADELAAARDEASAQLAEVQQMLGNFAAIMKAMINGMIDEKTAVIAIAAEGPLSASFLEGLN